MDKVSATPVPPVLETPTLNMANMAASNWMPSLNTPSLKLPTPVLESGDWGIPGTAANSTNANPVSSNTGAGGLLSAGPAGLGSGMSPRFMLDNLRMSPGVSGSIAPNAAMDAPKASSSSLAELFIVNEYSNPQQQNPHVNNHVGNSNNNSNKATAPVSAPMGMSAPIPSVLAVNVSQAQSQAHIQAQAQQQQQQQSGLPPKQPMHSLPVTVSAPQDTSLPVHSAAGALRNMQRPVHSHVPVPQQQHMVAPSNTAIPHPQQVAYAHARSMPMTHAHQPIHQAQPPIQHQQARYPEMGYPTAMPPTHAHPPQRMGMGMATGAGSVGNVGNVNARRAAPRPAIRATGNGSVVSSAIEEAKQNAQERADKFAQKRKRTRAAAQHDGPGKNNGSDSGDEREPGTAGDLKKKRYNRRLELNRQSAAVSRVRRRAYVEELEGKLILVEREKMTLEDQVSVMTNENGKLQQQLRHLHEQLSDSRRAGGGDK